MPPRTRYLLMLLLLCGGAYLWFNIDWSAPVTLYRNYQHIQALLANKEPLQRAEKSLREEFGDNTSLSYNISIDLAGVTTVKLQASRRCGDPDGKRFLQGAIQRVHDAGMGWPDQVEYLYNCNFSKPPSFKMNPEVMAQTLEQRVVEHSMCRDLTRGPYRTEDNRTQQSIGLIGGNVDMILWADTDGNAVKAQWATGEGAINPQQQYRLMLCMTYAALRTLEPDFTDAQVRAGWADIWRTTAGTDSVKVGRYTFDITNRPMKLVVYPTP